MAGRIKLIVVCTVSCLCILLLTISNQKLTIDQVIELERKYILKEMENFEYPSGRFGIDAKMLTDLTLETGGQPIRSVIISTWRSGSSFLGEIISSLPGSYYQFEPLQTFGAMQIRGPPNDAKAIVNLKKLLNCDYNAMDEYLDFGKENMRLFFNNPRNWILCREYPEFCFESKFLTPLCKIFPLQSMKIIRLRLALAEQLLDDASLNVRIILLVRDPRGTMQSRKRYDFCYSKAPDCGNAEFLCSDLVSDYYAAKILIKNYPTRFRVVRYEELSISPYNMSKDILDFYGLPFDPLVEEFLDTHTNENAGDGFSTFRNSDIAPFHWIKDSEWFEIENIEKICAEAMELWGYQKMNSSKDQNEAFDPMLPLTFT